MQIGRYWAGHDELPDASLHEEMGVVLVDESGDPIQPFEVYPCNFQAEQFFYSCRTQWRRSPLDGSFLSLDYPGVESAARMQGITITAELFEEIQAIELGAIGRLIDFPELEGFDVVNVGFDPHD